MHRPLPACSRFSFDAFIVLTYYKYPHKIEMLQKKSNHRFKCVECQFAYGEWTKVRGTMHWSLNWCWKASMLYCTSSTPMNNIHTKNMMKLQTTFSIIAKTPNHDQTNWCSLSLSLYVFLLHAHSWQNAFELFLLCYLENFNLGVLPEWREKLE